MKKLTKLIVFVFILFALSCSKDSSNSTNPPSPVTPSHKLVKKILIAFGTTIDFYYTSDKIDSIIFKFQNKVYKRQLFSYSNDLINKYTEVGYIEDGTIDKIHSMDIFYQNSIPHQVRGYNVLLDSPHYKNYTITNQFIDITYNTALYYIRGIEDTINFGSQYYKEVNGNIVELEINGKKYNYSFDNKQNPIHFIRNINKVSKLVFDENWIVLDQLYLNLNKNNVTEYSGDFSEKFTILYNSDSLPIKVVSNVFGNVAEYFY